VPHPVAFSPTAEKQLEELERYLADRFFPKNAERYITRITKACLNLGLAPHRGTSREDLGPGVRVTGFERRVSIYFKVQPDRVTIVGIFYAGQPPRNLR